jgi:hypothetical protein
MDLKYAQIRLWYQFTTGKTLKHLKLTLKRYENIQNSSNINIHTHIMYMHAYHHLYWQTN